LVLGDDMTTDHISPAGATQASSNAGEWLIAHGEDPADLNVYASRRGNWEVMLRGLFTNRSVRNLLSPGIAAGETQMPSGECLPLWQAAQRHNDQGNSVVIVAGERYGMGSSRDWAAKGVALLGVRAVLARSFERIHRTNLIGMGVLPLRFPAEMEPEMFGLVASDRIEIVIHSEQLAPRCSLPVVLHRSDGSLTQFNSIAAVETSHEVQMLLRGGMIPMVLARAAIRA
jgi:aconitate hydratase